MEQGNVFRQNILGKSAKEIESQSLWSRAISFDAYAMRAELSAIQSQSLWNRAMSFDMFSRLFLKKISSFNPFGTGQCLSTEHQFDYSTGNPSQSLWNRAMSFDTKFTITNKGFNRHSIPLEQGNVFRHCSGVFKPCVARLPRATSQLFLMPEELGINLIKY